LIDGSADVEICAGSGAGRTRYNPLFIFARQWRRKMVQRPSACWLWWKVASARSLLAPTILMPVGQSGLSRLPYTAGAQRFFRIRAAGLE